MKQDPPKIDEEDLHPPTTITWAPAHGRSLQSCSREAPGGHLVLPTLKFSELPNYKWGWIHKRDWERAAQTKRDCLHLCLQYLHTPVCSYCLLPIILFYLLLWPALKYAFSSLENIASVNQDMSLTSNSENGLGDLSPLLASFCNAG